MNDEIEQDLQFWSDRFKEANGFRPRTEYEWFRGLSEPERMAEIASLEETPIFDQFDGD